MAELVTEVLAAEGSVALVLVLPVVGAAMAAEAAAAAAAAAAAVSVSACRGRVSRQEGRGRPTGRRAPSIEEAGMRPRMRARMRHPAQALASTAELGTEELRTAAAELVVEEVGRAECTEMAPSRGVSLARGGAVAGSCGR